MARGLELLLSWVRVSLAGIRPWDQLLVGIKSKITKHTRKQENMTPKEEDDQSIETSLEQTQMLELTDKDIKTVILTVFHRFKEMFCRTIEDIENAQLNF